MENLRTSALPALGRLLMAAIFISAGYHKLGAPAGTIAYIAAHGMPLPSVSYALAVLIEFGGGLLILFGFQTRVVALFMALFCVVTAIQFHYIPDDANMMIHFMKNISMAGGFLQLAAWGAGTWSVDALMAGRSSAGRRVTA